MPELGNTVYSPCRIIAFPYLTSTDDIQAATTLTSCGYKMFVLELVAFKLAFVSFKIIIVMMLGQMMWKAGSV